MIAWIRGRYLPSWMPNPIDSFGLFVTEALTVVLLALFCVVVAAIALWVM